MIQQMSDKEKKRERRSGFNRFLTGIENIGNKIPDPMMLFVWLCIITVGASFVLSNIGFSGVNPATGETVAVSNLLSAEGLVRMITTAVSNFTGLSALGMVLVCMLGVGVCDRAGLFSAALRNVVENSRGSNLKIICIFVFICVMADAAGGTGFVVMPPLGAIIFMAMGRNPIAGMLCAYGAVSGAFASNLLVTSMDVVNLSFTETAAKLVDPNIALSPAINYYFSAFSVLTLTIVSVLVTVKIVEPRLGVYQGTGAAVEDSRGKAAGIKAAEGKAAEGKAAEGKAAEGKAAGNEQAVSAVTKVEKKALRWAVVTVAVYLVIVIAGVLPHNGLLRDPETGSALVSAAPLMKGLPFLIALLFFLPGVVYGKVSGSLKGSRDVARALGQAMADMGPYIALIFVSAQFLKYFEWSNIGIVLAIKGADLLELSGLPIPVVLVLFIIMCAFINLLIGGASTKWAILSPIFVPMFMFLGYHPALAQMAYRIGDSITNPICPTFAYFGMLLALAQKYDKKAGFGTLMANMLPYSIAFFCFMTVQLLIWFYLGIPFGPGAPLRASY